MGLANGAASVAQFGHVSRGGRRALFYSHDTFGLGHLRRTRAIANALVGAHPGLSVIIISGSPVIGSFEYGNGVDYVRVPGVVKQPDGDYTTMNLKVELDEAVRLREAIIRETASTFQPDLLGILEHADEAELRGAARPDSLLETRSRARHDQGRLVEREDLAEGVVAAHRHDGAGAIHQMLDLGVEGDGVDRRELGDPLEEAAALVA